MNWDLSIGRKHPKYYFGKMCVIIPCQNREENIKQSLPAWIAQTFNKLEIVIIDYNSDKPILPLVESITNKYGISLEVNPSEDQDRYEEFSSVTVFRIKDVKTWNISHALNYGIRHTTSDSISIAGCDTVPDPRYLELSSYLLTDHACTATHTGRLTFPRPAWYQINGYQEFCNEWGFEDNDFRHRLGHAGYSIMQINDELCPSLVHKHSDFLGRKMVHDRKNQKSLNANVTKCTDYFFQHGIIGNFCVFPGGEKPIDQCPIGNNVIHIAKLDDHYIDKEIVTRCCYAGSINSKTFYYILPQKFDDDIWSQAIRERCKQYKEIITEEPVEDILTNINSGEINLE